MSNSNTGNGSSGSKSDARQGSKRGSGNESNRQDSDDGSRASEKQLDEGSSMQSFKRSTRGGTHEQHVKAGEQSHKNIGASLNSMCSFPEPWPSSTCHNETESLPGGW